jgi:PAS domain S-box
METLRKIEELIVQNKILEQRNEELKNIIEVNLKETQDDVDLTVNYTVDLSDAKTLILKFYQGVKVPVALFDDHGKLIFSIGGKEHNSEFPIHYERLYQEYILSIQNKDQTVSKFPKYAFKLSNGTCAIAVPVELFDKVIAVIILCQFYYDQEMPFPEFWKEAGISSYSSFPSGLNTIPLLSDLQLESLGQQAALIGEMVSTLVKKDIHHAQQIKRQKDNNLILNALLDKISEQEQIIKSLLSSISQHKIEVRDNTIDKATFQRHQKQLVDRIKYSEALLNSLLTSVPLGIGFIKKNIFTYVNDQMFRLTGYTPKELIGRDPEILFDSQEVYQQILLGAQEHFLFKDMNSYEASLIGKDGSLVDVIVFVTHIDPEDYDSGLAISIMNISAMKQVQNEMIKEKERAEESDRLKTAFLNNMSHEIRTPMNAVMGFAELLSYSTLTEKQREYCDIILGNGKKLLRIIDDIIDVSKLSSNQLELKPEKVFLNAILTDLYDIFSKYVKKRHGNKVSLKLKLPKELSEQPVYTDSSRVRQIMSNLLSNSLKFTSRGIIEFGYTLDDGNIVFFVKDTGSGIKKSQVNQLFMKFRQCDDLMTREHGGAGLGLSLAKGLVELMGGRIWFESQWRKGTTFFFSIPVCIPEKSNIGQLFTRKTNDWSNKTILIAEDEELNYQYLQMLLEPTNAKIRWVDNGQKAIDSINEDPNINLILMDIRMPVVNGLDATKSIKASNNHIPIIAQTAYAQWNEKDYYLQAGCDDFIPKPINSGHFMSVLEKFLNTN